MGALAKTIQTRPPKYNQGIITEAKAYVDEFNTEHGVSIHAPREGRDIDTGSAYQQLQEAVAITAGFLVGISFTLKQERRLILDRSRTIIDLVAELYGSIDEQLDFFITSNNLSGSEILELPKGREIVYYV